jgi:hypothetical protein
MTMTNAQTELNRGVPSPLGKAGSPLGVTGGKPAF